MTSSEPVAADVRFAFGKNWSEFLKGLNENRIVEAEQSLKSLLGMQRLDGKTFIDIGSGSGLFSLAARRLGAKVHSFDYDPASVKCATSLRGRFFTDDPLWTIEQGSILDRSYLSRVGTYDIVYSWGVLHHTGAMFDAIRNAAALVRPEGLFAFALYRRTTLCKFWRIEKRWYINASPAGQSIARYIFRGLMRADFAWVGKDFRAYVENYFSTRGMDYERDLHDWLGGYPYESIAPDEVSALMAQLGFAHVHSNVHPRSLGLFGSGCDEFVYRAQAA